MIFVAAQVGKVFEERGLGTPAQQITIPRPADARRPDIAGEEAAKERADLAPRSALRPSFTPAEPPACSRESRSHASDSHISGEGTIFRGAEYANGSDKPISAAADGAFGSVLMADYELDRLSSGTRSQHD